jgi:hypothetical protein
MVRHMVALARHDSFAVMLELVETSGPVVKLLFDGVATQQRHETRTKWMHMLMASSYKMQSTAIAQEDEEKKATMRTMMNRVGYS